MQGLNLDDIKRENKSSVLYLLNSFPRLSRKDIARRLELTPAAVTKICAGLIKDGFISEQGEIDETVAKAGRKKVSLSLCLNSFYAMGINAQVDKITVCAVRLDGTLVKSSDVSTESSVDEIIEESKVIFETCGVDKSRFLCVSICVMGSAEGNRFGLWNIDEIKRKAKSSLGLPAVAENNIRSFALAEMIYGDAKPESAVLFLKWGPGIGSAIASDGRIVAGNDAGVAEIGHYIIRKDGVKCRCGRYGCLETEVSSMALMKETGKATLDEVTGSNEPDVVNLMDIKIDMVALALTNTATILDAKNIVLFGSVFKNSSVAQKLTRQCLRYNVNFSKDIIKLSKLNDKISYIGAAALAAKHFFFEKQN